MTTPSLTLIWDTRLQSQTVRNVWCPSWPDTDWQSPRHVSVWVCIYVCCWPENHLLPYESCCNPGGETVPWLFFHLLCSLGYWMISGLNWGSQILSLQRFWIFSPPYTRQWYKCLAMFYMVSTLDRLIRTEFGSWWVVCCLSLADIKLRLTPELTLYVNLIQGMTVLQKPWSNCKQLQRFQYFLNLHANDVRRKHQRQTDSSSYFFINVWNIKFKSKTNPTVNRLYLMVLSVTMIGCGYLHSW